MNKKGMGIGVCSVALVIATLITTQDTGEAQYPLRSRAIALEKLTGYHEGCRTNKYKDTGAIDTIGIGSTTANCGYIPNRELTVKEIALRFNKDVYVAEKCVFDKFDGVNMNQNQFEAMVDFVFNLGCNKASVTKNGNITKIRKYAIQQDYDNMCNAFLEWNKGRNLQGKLIVIKGLQTRRIAEKKWCDSND